VTYNIVGTGAATHVVTLGLTNTSASDHAGGELGTCNPTVAEPLTCDGATINVYCAIAQADVSDNGTVNAQDLGQVAQRFGQLPAPTQYEQDFNGVINSADLGLTAQRFFQTIGMCP
jgi:hypothetical protein